MPLQKELVSAVDIALHPVMPDAVAHRGFKDA